jgi:hypothetical protein
MLEFLIEMGCEVELPAAPLEIGSDEHAALFGSVFENVAERSQHLADMAVLGALIANYGIQAGEDSQIARVMAERIDECQVRYDLPAVDLKAFAFAPGAGQMDDILSPSLAYLTQAIATLEVEVDTTFVIMPFTSPYTSYFSKFYRPAIEASGRRAIRAWGGLGTEDYCDLLLQLISKAAIVWADISGHNSNVYYELGAAHALGKPSLIVVHEAEVRVVPSNILHDPIVRYSDATQDWPDSAIESFAEFTSILVDLAERGGHFRVRSRVLEKALSEQLASPDP